MTEQTKYSFDVEADPQSIWSFLWDTEAMARCIPGCEQVEVVQEHQSYRAQVRRKMGPFLIRMPLDITIAESVEPKLIRVNVKGSDRRLRSEVNQSIAVSLADAGGGKTTVDLDVSLSLTGILATLGKHLVKTQITQTLDEFVRTLRGAIVERTKGTSA